MATPTFENHPPGYYDRDERADHIREGLYVLTNKKSRSVLDLAGGWPGPGTHVLGFEQHIEWDNSNQMWLIKKDGLNGTYTVRNLLSGTFLDLEGGNPRNGSQVVGWPRELSGQSRANQEWYIEEKQPNYYMLQCFRTNTFMEIPGGNPSNCADVKCSELSNYKDHQLWVLDLASRTGADIKALFKLWKPNLLPQLFQLYAESTQYFLLRNNPRQEVWEETNLRRQPVRAHVFDYDDFVTKMKDAVANWAKNYFKVDTPGCAILFGTIYGEARRGPRAYNWYLSPDLSYLVFFDAQTGKEYGTTSLDSFGFEPTFAMF